MAELNNKSAYESLRNARISENKAKLESMGLLRSAAELRSIISSSTTANKSSSTVTKRPWNRIRLEDPPRRSERLNNNAASVPKGSVEEGKDFEVPEVAERLFSEMRSGGVVYDTKLGICCHLCRQKTLCLEDDCKRCVHLDVNKPCIGKTESSSCHSSNGVICGRCLKIRYGEELEEVRENEEWMCPHCVEKYGLNPYWICNSSFCLKKRKMAPIGISVQQARQQGYKSAAHLIMDKLKHKLG